MHKSIISAAITLSLTATAGFASAQSITNGSFEAVQIASPFASSNPADVPGWTHSGTVGDALIWAKGYCDGGGCVTATGDGNQFVTLGGGFHQFGSASWTQTVNGLTVGDSYVLNFKIAYEGGDTFPNPESITAAMGGTSQTYAATPNGINYWTIWQPEQLAFKATGASEDLVFSVVNGYNDIGLDAVSLSSAVPEPAAWVFVMIGLGLTGALLRSRNRAALA